MKLLITIETPDYDIKEIATIWSMIKSLFPDCKVRARNEETGLPLDIDAALSGDMA